jgi:hypothetical protein
MPERNLVFFPGSIIGNFPPGQAQGLLEVMRLEARPGGALLIGVDLRKNPASSLSPSTLINIRSMGLVRWPAARVGSRNESGSTMTGFSVCIT